MGLDCFQQKLLHGRWAGSRRPGEHHVKVFFDWQMRLILTL